mmetsp:Transcript_6695/g.19441  ORF Transcript_6695/g.19441 Transcript_6695/m.19441 type:complete len:137 (+) Transcript_6695:1055-1465(+)
MLRIRVTRSVWMSAADLSADTQDIRRRECHRRPFSVSREECAAGMLTCRRETVGVCTRALIRSACGAARCSTIVSSRFLAAAATLTAVRIQELGSVEQPATARHTHMNAPGYGTCSRTLRQTDCSAHLLCVGRWLV